MAHQDVADKLGLLGVSPTCMGKLQMMGSTTYVSGWDSPSQEKKFEYVIMYKLINKNID